MRTMRNNQMNEGKDEEVKSSPSLEWVVRMERKDERYMNEKCCVVMNIHFEPWNMNLYLLLSAVMMEYIPLFLVAR